MTGRAGIPSLVNALGRCNDCLDAGATLIGKPSRTRSRSASWAKTHLTGAAELQGTQPCTRRLILRNGLSGGQQPL